jgi:hypothetical protein
MLLNTKSRRSPWGRFEPQLFPSVTLGHWITSPPSLHVQTTWHVRAEAEVVQRLDGTMGSPGTKGPPPQHNTIPAEIRYCPPQITCGNTIKLQPGKTRQKGARDGEHDTNGTVCSWHFCWHLGWETEKEGSRSCQDLAGSLWGRMGWGGWCWEHCWSSSRSLSLCPLHVTLCGLWNSTQNWLKMHFQTCFRLREDPRANNQDPNWVSPLYTQHTETRAREISRQHPSLGRTTRPWRWACFLMAKSRWKGRYRKSSLETPLGVPGDT